MAYELHVERKVKTETAISTEEWIEFVEADPDLQFAGVISSSFEGHEVSYDNPLAVRWTGHPFIDYVFFDFRVGSVVAKNPDEIIIEKLKVIANSLESQVVGDDGEIYN